MTDETAPAAVGNSDGKQEIKVQGHIFTVRAPYAAGHTINENEAGALNQVFGENIRNNAAARMKRGVGQSLNLPEGETPTAAQVETADLDAILVTEGDGENAQTISLREAVQRYADTYAFGTRSTSTREPLDPVEREAKRIASDTLAEALRAKGIKRKDLPEGQFEAAVETLMAQEDVQKEAKRRVTQRGKVGVDNLEALLGAGEAVAA